MRSIGRIAIVVCALWSVFYACYRIIGDHKEPVQICRDALPACSDAIEMGQCVCVCPERIYE